MAVAAEWIKADVHPIGSRLRVLFPDKLVEWQIVPDVPEPRLPFVDVAVDAQVSRHSLRVLRGADTSYGLIQRLTPVAAPNLHFPAPPCPEWLQHILSESRQIHYLLRAWLVLYPLRLRRLAGAKFFEREVA